jgi:hypothetical protein
VGETDARGLDAAISRYPQGLSCEHSYPPGEYCPICGEIPVDRDHDADAVCSKCGGDGYVECWNHDQTDVVVTLCTDCGPAPGVHDG